MQLKFRAKQKQKAKKPANQNELGKKSQIFPGKDKWIIGNTDNDISQGRPKIDRYEF